MQNNSNGLEKSYPKKGFGRGVPWVKGNALGGHGGELHATLAEGFETQQL